jgi:hypothetical protein
MELDFDVILSLSAVFFEGFLDTPVFCIGHVVDAIGEYNSVLHGVDRTYDDTHMSKETTISILWSRVDEGR